MPGKILPIPGLIYPGATPMQGGVILPSPGGGPFSPLNIGGLQLWLKADAIVGLNDGDPVVTWSDSSGQGNDRTQGTAAARPTYQTNELNGLPVVRFDGTDDYLSGGTIAATSQAGELFVVAEDEFVISQLRTFCASSDDTTNNIWQCRLQNSGLGIINYIAGVGDVVAGGTLASNVPFIGNMRSSGTAYGLAINGVDQTITILDGQDDGSWMGDISGLINFPVGAYIAAGVPGQFWFGVIAELLFYNVAFTAAQRLQVTTYLNTKWAIF